MRKLIIGTLIPVALVIVVVVARATATRPQESAADADVLRVVRRDIARDVKATGVVKPMIGAEVRVGSRISGVVRRLHVRVGDMAERGQLLAELDDRDLEARRAEALAALRLAEANLSWAEADLQRKQELTRVALTPAADLDLAERAWAVAEQQHAGAKSRLDLAITELGYARIVAPISGVVASVSTQEGETVAASFSTPTFLTLVDLTRLEVWAYVDETDIGRIRIGQEVRFTVDTYGDEEFRGDVTTIHPKPEIRDNVVNYVTVIRFTPPVDRIIRPEMTTTVRIVLEARSGVLALPLAAVRREDGRPFVWLRRGDGVERRWVTTSNRDERYVEIASGLAEGEEVLMGKVEEK